MSRTRGEWSVLTPAGHPAIDEFRIALEQRVGPEAQTFHHAGSEALDDGVGSLRKRECDVDAVRTLQVERDRTATTQHHVVPALAADTQPWILRPIDKKHVGAHVREHHVAKRAGADGLEHQHAYARKWSHWSSSCSCFRRNDVTGGNVSTLLSRGFISPVTRRPVGETDLKRLPRRMSIGAEVFPREFTSVWK